MSNLVHSEFDPTTLQRRLRSGASAGILTRVSDSPFDAVVGHELDTVSFVRDYVELRIDYSVFRLLTAPTGVINDDSWCLTDAGGADALRGYIGRSIVATSFDEHEHLLLVFDDNAIIRASLLDEDRSGPEALHFMPADGKGTVHTATMYIW